MANGYVHIQIDGVLYLAHRLAWLLSKGSDPGAAQIDHRNGQRTDNRSRNLRLALRCEADNTQNTKVRRDSTSRYTGVAPRGRRWRAYIHVNRKQYHLGCFSTKKEAKAAHRKAKAEMHRFQPTPVERK